MIVDILTLFPEFFRGFSSSIIKRAEDNGIVTIRVHNYRDYSVKKSRRVDDYSYGGGAGMIIEVQPIADCLRAIPGYEKAKKIITSPLGSLYSQKKAIELSQVEHMIIVCGHYEGIDARIHDYVDESICIGDYILTGGEIASMVICDSVIRLLPGALGNEESTAGESFAGSLLEYPQYTRPVEYEGKKVPDVLLSGNHEEVRRFRRFQALSNTYHLRPDLLEKAELTNEDRYFLEKIKKGEEL